ncbi:MAG: hypothetical protein AB7H96_01870 [Vicinamibacterales bacterium]
MRPEFCAPQVHRLLTPMVDVYVADDGGGGWTLAVTAARGLAAARGGRRRA